MFRVREEVRSRVYRGIGIGIGIKIGIGIGIARDRI